MANETVRVITDKENIVAIADAVRSKTGSTDEMTLTEIVSGINSIETGGGVETCTVTFVNNNNTYTNTYKLRYVIYENETVKGQEISVPYGETVVMNNVVCGSAIWMSNIAIPTGNCVGATEITDVDLGTQVIAVSKYGFITHYVDEVYLYVY